MGRETGSAPKKKRAYTAADSRAYDELVIREAMAVLEKRLKRPVMKSSIVPATATKLAEFVLKGEEREHFWVAFLNAQNQLIGHRILFSGTVGSSAVHPREVVKEALRANASGVIFAHNHPSGIPEPSRDDEMITQRLKSALELVDVRVLDHIVVGFDSSVSMSERGLI